MKEGTAGARKKILAILAHPDDAELSSGGTIAQWIQEGHEVQYVICTDGSKGTKDPEMSPYRLAEMREKEQQAAANVLGVKGVTFLRHRDGELEADLAFRSELATLIRYHRPDTILTHDPWRSYMIHPDHRAVGLSATDGVVAARDHLYLPALLAIGLQPHSPKEVLYIFPENPDMVSDISDFIEIKIEAVSQHRSQLILMRNWQERVRKRASQLAEGHPFPFAETFKRMELS